MPPESPLTRMRNAVKPLPANGTPRPAALAQKRKQRRLIRITAGALALLACGWFLYSYLANAPQRARTEFDRGMLKMGPGSYPQAIAVFSRAIAIWPGFADAYLSRGIAEHGLGDTDHASADLDHASDLNPNLTRAYDERGRIYLEKGDTLRAIAEFTKSLRIQPTTDGYYQRGLAYESLGDHRKALADYDDAIAELRDAPYAYRARALAKDALGDAEGARLDRETAQRFESQ